MKYEMQLENNILTIQLIGDFIGEDSGIGLVNNVNEKINEGIKLCAIDLTKLRFINSTGVGALITILTKFRNKGGEVVLVNPSEKVQKLLTITKLNAIFNVSSTKKEALEKLENC